MTDWLAALFKFDCGLSELSIVLYKAVLVL